MPREHYPIGATLRSEELKDLVTNFTKSTKLSISQLIYSLLREHEAEIRDIIDNPDVDPPQWLLSGIAGYELEGRS